MKPAVAYYRLTTSRGPLRPPKPQVEAVETYANEHDLEVVEGYVGRDSTERKGDWPVLQEAAKTAKERCAALLLAKIGRLYLSPEYIKAVIQASPDVIALDQLALFAKEQAEKEAGVHDVIITDPLNDLLKRAVEFRNKCAHNIRESMGKLKSEGRKFGTDNLTHEDRVKGAFGAGKQAMLLAATYYEPVVALIHQLKSEGKSLRAIAAELNGRAYLTRYGKPYNPMTVRNLLMRKAGR